MLTMGLDPYTAGLLSQLGGNLISNIFSPGRPAAASGVSAAQVAAVLEQRRQRDAATRNAWLIGGGLVVAGGLALFLLRR